MNWRSFSRKHFIGGYGMTYALCFSCGGTKFGALNPCFECGSPATGDMNLDIAFSDHHISKASLEKLGEVVASINSHSDDEQLCFWTFIHYVSIHHPSILGVDLDSELQAQAEELLAGVALAKFELESG